MTEVMTRIELGGVLGKNYGKVHHRLISTTAEAINSLTKTIDGFEKFLISSKARGLTYAVFKDKKNIKQDDFGFPVTGEVIRIVPVVIGVKKQGYYRQYSELFSLLLVWLLGISQVELFQPRDMVQRNLVQP
jgi:predicted phage tail protein